MRVNGEQCSETSSPFIIVEYYSAIASVTNRNELAIVPVSDRHKIEFSLNERGSVYVCNIVT